MRKIVVVLGLLLCSASVWAQETPVESAVINNPVTGWTLTKDLVNYLEPGADWIIPFTHHDTIEALSGAIYTFKSQGWPIASIRAGYGLTDPLTYASVAIDLPGIVGRFTPQILKDSSPAALNGAIAFAAKYLRTGVVAGYDWDVNHPVYGASVGAAVTINF